MIRGDIYWIKFKDPDKLRPALIITRNSAIQYLNSVTVLPITEDGMPQDCLINIDNIQTVSKAKLVTYITHLSENKMDEVFEAIKFAFGFDN